VISGTPEATGTSTFTVSATDSESTPVTAYSGSLSITVVANVPGAPTGLVAVPGPAQVALSWIAPSFTGGDGPLSYTVLRGTTAGSLTAVATGLTATSWTDNATNDPSSPPVNNTTYYYEVEAVNTAGNSAASNEVSASPASTTCAVATSPGSCTAIEQISATVVGTNISITETQYSTNPSAQNVTLSTVTLGSQLFQNATGQLNTVHVSDDRGTLAGWTVTAWMEGDFANATATGNSIDNYIPADFLTWTPTVSLWTPGSLPNGNANTPFCPSAATCIGPSGLPATASVTTPAIVGGTLPQGYNGQVTGTGGIATIPAEVFAGPTAVLNNKTLTGAVAQTLCEAPAGGGGGGFDCNAALSLAVPPYVAAGTYSATMDVILTAL
jgi:hypothetical protein